MKVTRGHAEHSPCRSLARRIVEFIVWVRVTGPRSRFLPALSGGSDGRGKRHRRSMLGSTSADHVSGVALSTASSQCAAYQRALQCVYSAVNK